MYAFQLSFPFPGVVPAFLNIVQNRKILRSDLIIHFFWHQFQPAMFPALFFLNSLADHALKHISSLIQLKDKTTNLQKVQTEGMCPSQLTEIFLNLTLQTVKCLQKMDWQGMAQMQKWMAQARADSASTAANDTASADGAKKKSYFIECTYMHKLSEWIIRAEVSITSKHLAVCGIKHYVICEHTEHNWCS